MLWCYGQVLYQTKKVVVVNFLCNLELMISWFQMYALNSSIDWEI